MFTAVILGTKFTSKAVLTAADVTKKANAFLGKLKRQWKAPARDIQFPQSYGQGYSAQDYIRDFDNLNNLRPVALDWNPTLSVAEQIAIVYEGELLDGSMEEDAPVVQFPAQPFPLPIAA
jgi:hypothetical protein